MVQREIRTNPSLKLVLYVAVLLFALGFSLGLGLEFLDTLTLMVLLIAYLAIFRSFGSKLDDA
jgi:hypothetical protein